MAKWRLHDARKNLDALVEQALTDGPQTITVSRGRSVVVQAIAGRAGPKSRAKKLSEVFAGVPLAEIIPPRSKEPMGRGAKFD